MLRRFQGPITGMLLAAVGLANPIAVCAQSATTKPAATTTATTTATSQPVFEPNPALGERIAYQMAQGLLRAQKIMPTTWSATSALLEAALRLEPDEPRIQRLLIEALLREGDTKRALEVLNQYRATEEGKDDDGAQTQAIDLYLSQLETVEKQIQYLRDIVDRAGIADQVQSYAAMRCAELLSEHMQDTEALKMVDQALRLNPYNLRALRIKYETLKNGTPTEQLAGMLQMLKSNPAQPALALAVAQYLADAGLVQPSLQWYAASLNMYPRTGTNPGRDVITDYAAELFISGDARAADGVAQRLTGADADSLNAWLLRLIITRSAGDKETLAAVSRQAAVSVTNRLAMLKRQAGDKTATTRPVDPTSEVPVVDVMSDLAALQKANQPELLSGFAMVAQAMAWLKIYFDEKPADADPWLNAMAKVVPANDDTLVRLQGWQLIKAGKIPQGRAKLQTVASSDALAAAGLVLTAENTPAAQDKAASEGRQLLSQNPSGLTGAMLFEVLSARGIRLVPGPLADQLQVELAKFPRDLMQITDERQAARFYSLRIEPVRSALQVGDPVLVRVTIMNSGDFDLTVGPDGIIHNDLWLDAQLRGADQQFLASESFDRITKRLVLSHGQSMSQVVRLDSTQLNQVLMQTPQKSFQISAMCMTNPITIQGNITNGLGGYRVQMTKLMERQGSPIGQEPVRNRINNAMLNGTPEDKVKTVELVGTYFLLFSSSDDAQAKQVGAPFGEAVRRAATDADPGVRAWAMYALGLLANDKDRAVVVRAMVQDAGWQARLIAAVVVELTGTNKELLKPLENDPDPIVKKMAIAVGQMPLVPRQNPATQPAPGAAPGAPGAIPAPTSAPTGAPAVESPAPSSLSPTPAASSTPPAAPGTGAAPISTSVRPASGPSVP